MRRSTTAHERRDGPDTGREVALMGKALLGTHVTPNSLRLLDEVRALRARVAELERALAEAEDARDAREQLIEIDAREPVRT
jgi:hypothetical protein